MAQSARQKESEAGQEFDEQLKTTLALLQKSFQTLQQVDIEAVAMRRESSTGPVAINSFGTAGTAGTLTGCFGTAGTFGCLGATDMKTE